jgi:hypothetical protein
LSYFVLISDWLIIYYFVNIVYDYFVIEHYLNFIIIFLINMLELSLFHSIYRVEGIRAIIFNKKNHLYGDCFLMFLIGCLRGFINRFIFLSRIIVEPGNLYYYH